MAFKFWPTEADLPTSWRPAPMCGAIAEQAVIDACTKVTKRHIVVVDDNQRQDRGR